MNDDNTNHDDRPWQRPRRAPTLVVLLLAMGVSLSQITTAIASSPEDPTFDANTSYPTLPDLPGADIRGQSGIVIHLRKGRTVVEYDDGLYELGDRTLEIGFDGLDQVTLWFVFVDCNASTLFMTHEGLWTQTFGLYGPGFDYVIRRGGTSSHGFELASPGQGAPTVPDIVIKPIEPT